MNACQIRVITNGYIIVWMEGVDLKEYSFSSRKEMLVFLNDNLDNAKEAD